MSPPSPDPKHGLFLDRLGRWHHDGDPIRHQRLATLLTRSIARSDTGELIVTTGRDRLPFSAEDAPLHVAMVERTAETLRLVFIGGYEEPLSTASTPTIDDDGVVRVRCRGGTFWARLSREAAQAIAEHIVETEQGSPAIALPDGTYTPLQVGPPRGPLDA